MSSSKLSLILPGIVLCAIVSGCVFNTPPPQSAMGAANATAESIFQSFNTGDYGQFSQNMSVTLKSGLNESSFSTMRGQINDKYGSYVSKSAPQASTVQGYNNFIYDCRFEKGSLKIRLVMNSTDEAIVQGLWFPGGI